jgi:hypothetical protein
LGRYHAAPLARSIPSGTISFGHTANCRTRFADLEERASVLYRRFEDAVRMPARRVIGVTFPDTT